MVGGGSDDDMVDTCVFSLCAVDWIHCAICGNQIGG